LSWGLWGLWSIPVTLAAAGSSGSYFPCMKNFYQRFSKDMPKAFIQFFVFPSFSFFQNGALISNRSGIRQSKQAIAGPILKSGAIETKVLDHLQIGWYKFYQIEYILLIVFSRVLIFIVSLF
jgi:hypothetical protein